MYELTDECRSCSSPNLESILSLGITPLADGLVDGRALGQPEAKYPLDVVFCPSCSLVQITATVDPDLLFRRDYPYFSSFSDELLRHSRENAERLIRDRRLGPQSLVVEIASNDGYMLRSFSAQGIPVLGIDPAEGPVEAARALGIPTLCTFFTEDLAAELARKGKRADVLIANNVLAHVPDQNELVRGMRTLLRDTGVAVIEVPYVRDLIESCAFDTIYHEHHCYFSVTALKALFERNGLFLNHVEHYPIHGGSLRLFLESADATRPSAVGLLEEEESLGMTSIEYYQDFAYRVDEIRDRLVGLLTELKEDGASVAAYGAAAKGATLLNYAGIGADVIDFVVDRNVHKQGRYMPGVHIPILSAEELTRRMPDYTLLLTWNFRDEILRQQQEYIERGGRFIVPIPRPEIVQPVS